ncbi:Acetyltransferase (GNAT) family protein [Oceanobacillus limi]|uniref:Acetyltransferase (GNAT) family protein n=1 Tax=Oceanobacillus limi TaxID=930131 RepID=A0A1I0CGW4_9BACI|nr:GNAT family N-acetyltransferase [Oceanobacillus limi]SET18346.1 Acetyltransferase (GNAT) family protein [Oceanobacillus limi]
MNLHVDNQEFDIVQAKKSDVQAVLYLLQQAVIWLQTKGTTQWDYYITDLEGNSEEVIESIENGSTYLVYDQGSPVATITLEDRASEWDTELWGKQVADVGVVYLHRIVVDRNYEGMKIGENLIKWAIGFVKDRGKKYIRFDCLASNHGLNEYYQRHCKQVGIATIYGNHSKYEIRV